MHAQAAALPAAEAAASAGGEETADRGNLGDKATRETREEDSPQAILPSLTAQRG